MEAQILVGELGIVGGLRQVEPAVHGHLQGDVEAFRNLKKLPQSAFGNVQAEEPLSGAQLQDLAAVAGDHQVFPDGMTSDRRGQEAVLPSRHHCDGDALLVGGLQSLLQPGGEGLAVGAKGGAVQVHADELDIHVIPPPA